MADLNRGDRPLSPFMIGQYYRPQITSVLSLMHRATGCAMALGAMLLAWWMLALASGPEYFAVADGFMTSFIGHIILLGSTWALCYHLCNGIRHLWWDLGLGFDMEQVTFSGQITLVASGALTLITWIIAM